MTQKLFDLSEEDHYLIDRARGFIMNFLKRTGDPMTIIGLGNALLALDRMPKPTEGVCCEFGVSMREQSDGYGELKYMDFQITSEGFYISRGGSVYDPQVGSDSYSLSGWCIELGGYRNTEACPYDLENFLDSLISLGANFRISDDSSIDYDKIEAEEDEDEYEDDEAEEDDEDTDNEGL